MTEPAQRAALAVLEPEAEAELLKQVAELVARRTAVRDGLLAQGWHLPEPQGNFVWLATGEATAAAAEVLEAHGIVARVFAPDGIRISIGEAESVEKVLEAAAEVVATLREDVRSGRARVVTMSSDVALQLLTPDGTLVRNDRTSEYLPLIEALDEKRLGDFYRQMAVIRRFDVEAGNLQRQGQLALWIPSIGQEAAQVGSGYAALPQDHIFPAYREHVVGTHPRTRSDAPDRDAARPQPRRVGAQRDRQLPPVHAGDRLADAARHRLRDGDRARRTERHRRSREG